MARFTPYPLETQQAVEALLHDSGLSMRRIAERIGVSYATVKLWNRDARIRLRSQAARLEADPRTWSVGRIKAAARLFEREDIDQGELAEAMGARRGDAPALMLACGLAAAKETARQRMPGDAPDLAGLAFALRGHIARQIAAFDAQLNRPGPATDSARVLRDLGGLKRLLDDLKTAARDPESDGDADGGSPQDLAALRERLARRIAAFAAEPGAADAGGPGA